MPTLRLIREDPLLPYLVGGAVLLAAITVRLELDSLPPAVAFITFFPAIVLIAASAGWRIAAAGTGLSALSAWWLLLRPAGAPNLARTGDLLAVAVFMASAGLIIAVVESLAGLAWPREQVADMTGQATAAGVAALLKAAGAVLEDAPGDATALEAARARLGLLRLVADELEEGVEDTGGWLERLRAMCDRILRERQISDVAIRIDAARIAVPPDQRAMLAIIVAELLPTTPAETRAEALDVVLRDIGDWRRVLEVRGGGAFGSAGAGKTRDRILRLMTEMLGATLTFSRDPGFVARVEFSARPAHPVGPPPR